MEVNLACGNAEELADKVLKVIEGGGCRYDLDVWVELCFYWHLMIISLRRKIRVNYFGLFLDW